MTLPIAGLQTRSWRAFAQPRAVSLSTHLVQSRCVALGAPLSDRRLAWLDVTVMKPLEAGGLLAKMDVFYLPGRMPTAVAANVNPANPGTYDLVPTNSPAFAADGYYETDGAASYLATGYRPQASGTIGTMNSAHIGVRLTGTVGVSGSGAAIGQSTGSARTFLRPRYTGDLIRGALNGDAANLGSSGDGTGHAVLVRRDASTLYSFRNGSPVASAAAASSEFPAGTLDLGRLVSQYLALRFEAAHGGAALSDGDVAAIDTAFDAAWAGSPPP